LSKSQIAVLDIIMSNAHFICVSFVNITYYKCDLNQPHFQLPTSNKHHNNEISCHSSTIVYNCFLPKHHRLCFYFTNSHIPELEDHMKSKVTWRDPLMLCSFVAGQCA